MRRPALPARFRLIAVCALPLLPLLLGAAHQEHAVEVTGGSGSYEFGACSVRRTEFLEGSVRYTQPVHDNVAVRIEGGAVHEQDEFARVDPEGRPIDPEERLAYLGRAQVLLDWTWLGAGAGVLVTGPEHPGYLDDSSHVLPAGHLRLGPRQINARLSLLDGGLTGGFTHLMGVGIGFDLPLADELGPGMPHLEGLVALEGLGNDNFVSASVRTVFDGIALIAGARISADNEASRTFTLGVGIPLGGFME